MAVETIDEWNDLLNPPVWENSNSSDSTEAEPGGCDCCEMPKCCPPLLECESLTYNFQRAGFLEFGGSSESSDSWMVYRRSGNRTTRTESGSASDEGTSADCGYAHSEWSSNTTQFIGYEVERVYYGGVGAWDGSDSNSESSDDGCPYWSLPEEIEVCSASGTATFEFSETHCYGDGIDPPTPTYARSYRYEYTLSDADGETTEAFAAWRETYPTDSEYDDAVSAYEDYVTALNDWNSCEALTPGECGPEPDVVNEPNGRPEEFYGPCWYKITTIITIDPHYFGYNSDGTSADDPDPVAFSDWLDDGAIGEPPCSGTGEIYSYTNTPVSSMPSWGGDTDTTDEVVLEEGVDKAGWIALVQAIIDEHEFPVSNCMGDLCYATREISENISIGGNDIQLSEQRFRYRWKLNKCCSTYSKLQWLLVFYPQEFLDWLSIAETTSSDSDPPENLPDATEQAWEADGLTISADCAGMSDSVSSDSDFDPFDDETFWSPWSSVVKVPDGEEGMTMIRDLYITCYRSDYGTVPDYIELYGTYDSNDLDGNQIADSLE